MALFDDNLYSVENGAIFNLVCLGNQALRTRTHGRFEVEALFGITLAKKLAYVQYKKFLHRLNTMTRRNHHLKHFLNTEKDPLEIFRIPESTIEEDTDIHDSEEVVEMLRNLFDSPVTIFDEEFFHSAFYLVLLSCISLRYTMILM